MADSEVSSASTARRIKEVGLRAGAKVVGIAAADAFNRYVPQGHRPEDFLPGAKSVIVAGGDGPTAGAWHAPDHDVIENIGYDLRENVAVHVMVDLIEHECGYYAIQAPACEVSGHTPPMSMMLAAVLAGLGTRSLAANIMLHPEYGMLYYAALITTMPLQPDHLVEKDVCPAPSCVKMWERFGTPPCLSACPSKNGGCLDGKLENGRIVETYYNRDRCHTRVYTNWIPGFQKVLEEAMSEEDREKRKMLLFGNFFTSTSWSLTFSAQSQGQCFECMRVCPVGKVVKK